MSNGNQTKELDAEVVAPGLLAGRLCEFEGEAGGPDDETTHVDDPVAEIERFEKHVDTVVNELEAVARSLRENYLDVEADIVRAHAHLLKDPQFHREVQNQIRGKGLSAQKAADKVLRRIMATIEESGTLLSERTADFRDILNRLKAKLSEREGAFIESLGDISRPVIVTSELLPSLVLEARGLNECAFIVEKGTATSHAAILAKSFGFPAVKIGNLTAVRRAAGKDVLVDAISGQVVLNPDARRLKETREKARRAPAPKPKSSIANIWTNITDPLQLNQKVLMRVEGIGLYRTEVLFMSSKDGFPSEEEQYQVYRRLFATCGRTPVTFRTADIGGDKMLPYFSLGPQENPYLGLRAHRIYRFHPEIFVAQVRALLRAAHGRTQLRIMYPMIEDIEEFRFVQSLLSQALNSLKGKGVDFQESFLQGIMIEVPSAAWDIDALLGRVDFASVGTNDLLQYFLAADRNNSNIAAGYRAQSPAFLRMLKSLVLAADSQAKPLSICGEIASSRNLLPLLVGIGFKDISVDIHALDQVEQVLGNLARSDCEELADACLHCRTSEEVSVMLREFGHAEAAANKPPEVATDEAIDPVCRMVVHASESSYTYDLRGERYYFCSAHCRDEFTSNFGAET